ncbi:MAG TPA: peptidase C14 [Cytophagales bacterium]|nr:peptidase C14 [Cytophagales bacterium]HAA24031.1 peptidase C14 [Cytophagales bacterium]HAP64674.1 peptidase C14 [Cytophagales bacterium]
MGSTASQKEIIKKALLIGISGYKNQSLEDLDSPINDVEALQGLLSRGESDYSSFDTVQVEKNVPKQGNLRKLIREFFRETCETGLFYFSGHGVLEDGKSYLATPDGEEMAWGVPINEVIEAANRSSIKNKVIILDCCHSGAAGMQHYYDGKPYMMDDRLISINNGVTILAASNAKEETWDMGDLSLFTSLLVEALKGGAADVVGRITPSSVYAFIDQNLGEGFPRPEFKANVSGFTVIRKVKPPVDLDILHQIITYFKNKDDEYDLSPTNEFTNDPAYVEMLKPREPYAIGKDVKVFKHLQKMVSVGLVEPVGEKHMYFAAMNSKSCRLTPLGKHYWNLVKNNRLKPES